METKSRINVANVIVVIIILAMIGFMAHIIERFILDVMGPKEDVTCNKLSNYFGNDVLENAGCDVYQPVTWHYKPREHVCLCMGWIHISQYEMLMNMSENIIGLHKSVVDEFQTPPYYFTAKAVFNIEETKTALELMN